MKIFCVGNNYNESTPQGNDYNENVPLGNKMQENTLLHDSEPMIFLKADSSLLKNHKPFFVPDNMGRIDCEGEVVVRINKLGKTVPERFAHRYYDAVTLGIDFTAREMQQRLAENGQPWDLAKSFDGAAVIGDWIDKEKLTDIQRLRFHLDINGVTAQEGYTGDMLHRVDEVVAYVSQFFTLKTGDLLFTGAPVAAKPVNINDHLEGWIEERKVLDFWCK